MYSLNLFFTQTIRFLSHDLLLHFSNSLHIFVNSSILLYSLFYYRVIIPSSSPTFNQLVKSVRNQPSNTIQFSMCKLSDNNIITTSILRPKFPSNSPYPIPYTITSKAAYKPNKRMYSL